MSITISFCSSNELQADAVFAFGQAEDPLTIPDPVEHVQINETKLIRHQLFLVDKLVKNDCEK